MAQPLPLFLTDHIGEAYASLGIPFSLKDAEAGTTAEQLTAILDAARPKLQEIGSRLYPSTFDPESPDLRGFPRPVNPSWPSCERALRLGGSHAVMVRLPHFWQLESPTHAACRNVGAPIFVGEPENIPVGAAAIFSAGIDTVITEATEAFPFVTYLQEKGVVLPRNWILVHRSTATSWAFPEAIFSEGISLTQEVHAMPGVAVLTQCAILAGHKKPLFHTSESYVWETINGRSAITSLGDDPLPLLRYLLPLTLQEEGLCACGRKTLSAAPAEPL